VRGYDVVWERAPLEEQRVAPLEEERVLDPGLRGLFVAREGEATQGAPLEDGAPLEHVAVAPLEERGLCRQGAGI
jgi:hypothetical protein